MGNLGDILKSHAKRLGIARQVEAVGVVEAATKEIEKFVPREDFEVVSFKDGNLKVNVNSSSAANEIQLNVKTNLMLMGDKNIKRVIVKTV